MGLGGGGKGSEGSVTLGPSLLRVLVVGSREGGLSVLLSLLPKKPLKNLGGTSVLLHQGEPRRGFHPQEGPAQASQQFMNYPV